MPWRVGRWLLLGSLLPLALGIFFLAAPVRNPGVQDCGVPVIFAITGRTNVRVTRDDESASADRLSELRAQTPVQRAGEPTDAVGYVGHRRLFVLALAGAAVGLADDRLRLRHSTDSNSCSGTARRCAGRGLGPTGCAT